MRLYVNFLCTMNFVVEIKELGMMYKESYMTAWSKQSSSRSNTRKQGQNIIEVGVIFHFYVVYIICVLENLASSKQVGRKWCACRTSLKYSGNCNGICGLFEVDHNVMMDIYSVGNLVSNTVMRVQKLRASANP